MFKEITSKGYEKMNKKEQPQEKRAIDNIPRCPYCNGELKKWKVPQTVFTEWPNEYFYVCLNDECSYFVQGWEAMANQGVHCSYRLMYDPLTDRCQPIPVMNKNMLRDQIVE
jgi:hypothetical protein